jgi:predicted 3-demethylubiquinone-9 3-methyltransferase (glyoxalase superfamily)
VLPKLLSNPGKAQKVMEAFMKMNKFDIKTLEEV